MSEEQETKPDDQTEFLARATKLFEQDASDERELRTEAEKDLAYVAGDQWDEKLKSDRTRANRPALTFNRCHTFVQQVANEARQNKPQIKFAPAEDADMDTAEVYEGLARHIQYSSDAATAYENAVDYSAGGGFGYFRFLTDYCDNETFNQEIKVVPVYDPMSVYGVLIPSCFGQEPDHAFVVEELTKAQFEQEYPNSKMTDWDVAVRDGGGWIGTETCRVAEYWYIDKKTSTLEKNGKKREVVKKTVKCAKINGVEVLEEYEWPGTSIPIFPVLGKQLIVKGKARLFSVVRFQRDPQALINLYKTRIAETLSVQPISPVMAAEGQIEGYENQWQGMNQNLYSVLTYKLVGFDGKPIPPPQRQIYEPPIQSYSAAAAQEIDDMKATAGIFDASIGSQSNETSGIAIARRQQQSNITNLHFMDNLERAYQKAGKALAELMPIIYDTPQTIRILGKDEMPKLVKINQEHQIQGRTVHYKVGGDDVGKYDIVVTMGRGFSTKRMETYDTITSLLQTSPDQFPIVADVLFRNSDSAGSDILAERYHKLLPPQLQDDKSSPQAQLQTLQGQLQQATQHLQAIDAFAKQLQQEKEAKVIENQAKAQIAQMQEQTRIEIVKLQEATKLAVAQISASKDANQAFAEQEIKQYQILHDAAHDIAMQKDQQAHEQGLAQQQAEQAQQQQESQQGHEMNMQQQAAENAPSSEAETQ